MENLDTHAKLFSILLTHKEATYEWQKVIIVEHSTPVIILLIFHSGYLGPLYIRAGVEHLLISQEPPKSAHSLKSTLYLRST